jgi:hypothetical protein
MDARPGDTPVLALRGIGKTYPSPGGEVHALRAVEASVALLSGDPRAAANHLALGSVGPGTLGVASGVAAWRGDRAAFDAALAQLGPPQTDPFWRTVEAWALEGAADAWMGHGDAVRAAAARALRDARRWEPTA